MCNKGLPRFAIIAVGTGVPVAMIAVSNGPDYIVSGLIGGAVVGVICGLGYEYTQSGGVVETIWDVGTTPMKAVLCMFAGDD